MTDPGGRSFLSYTGDGRAARRLIEAQREIGIPTWRDLDDLGVGPIAEHLRTALQSAETANAVFWITEEALRSDWILRLELEEALRRHERRDGFFFLLVAAGIRRREAIEGLRQHFGLADPSAYTIEESPKAVPTAAEARRLARRVLAQRLAAIAAHPRQGPLRVELRTWPAQSDSRGSELVLDWRHRFGVADARLAEPKSWSGVLLPALRTVRDEIGRHRALWRIEVGGRATLSAAAAFGVTFLEVSGFELTWRQEPGPVLMSLREPAVPVELEIRSEEGHPAGTDLAVLLSVTKPVPPDFAAFRRELPPLRAVVHVAALQGDRQLRIAEPGQATAIVERTIEETVRACARFRPKRIHWFGSIPLGVAMLLGQRLNTLPPSQLYERLEDGGRYVPSVLLQAGT